MDSYDLQRFLSDYRDLSSWIASMMGLVSSDELATDVTGAEALLERHQVECLFYSGLWCANTCWPRYLSIVGEMHLFVQKIFI